MKNANSTWLNGRPLERDLEGRLGRPVRVMNDANCFALSEATDGAAAGAPVVFGVILGTGVGGGIVVDGRCLAGANLIAGEWGHNPLPWVTPDEQPGPPCYCGKRGKRRPRCRHATCLLSVPAPIRSPPASCAPPTVIRAAYEGRRGCGPRAREVPARLSSPSLL